MISVFQRAAAVIVALVLAATSGSVGGIAYLCLMDGKVRAACCCAKSVTTDRDPAPEACAQVERSRDCCEVQVSEHEQAPARFEIGQRPIHLASFVVVLPPPAVMAPPPQEVASLPPRARGPPPPTGPPLFVWNCSYLI